MKLVNRNLIKFLSCCKTLAQKESRRTTSKYSRNVVVTGIGIVSPLGCGTQRVWEGILKGESGVTRVEGEDFEKLPSKVIARVPCGTGPGEFDENKYKDRSRSCMAAYALAATEEALNDAKWSPQTEEEKQLTGLSIGTCIPELDYICNAGEMLKMKGHRTVPPHFAPRILVNLVPGEVAIKHQLKGPNHCVSTACATGAHAIGDAMRMIAHGDCDVMVAGGVEACITPLAFAAFSRIRALTTKYNDIPEKASRPFHPGRDGFVMGEGAAILVLEEESHALKRGARVYARVAGYGMSGDAENIVSPSTGGEGAIRCMDAAVRDAGFDLSYITYINAHATSTPQGDLAEATAIMTLFGSDVEKLAVSSTKGHMGHLLGAAGAFEAAVTVLACYHSILPPTANLDELDPNINLNCVPIKPQKWVTSTGTARIALKNSFGFGGTNTSLCFTSV